jgi:hypothetical protein
MARAVPFTVQLLKQTLITENNDCGRYDSSTGYPNSVLSSK